MELLASGRDCDVYDCGDGTVLRRSRRAHDQVAEARILRHVAEHGYRVPAVHRLEDDGRDLVMEKVEGPTMAQALERRPWRAKAMGRVLADLHRRLHTLPAPDWLPALPEGDALLHFDLHPQNVILAADGPVVIDWNNSCRGRPGVDVARAWTLMACAEVDVSPLLHLVLDPVVGALVRSFVDAAGREEARAALAYAVEVTLLDPNISETEKERGRALAAAEAT